MSGVGSGGASEGDGSTWVLVHEFVTGGGLAGRDLPPSWAAEGSAMRRAIANDFVKVPGVRVVMTLDERLPDEPGAASRVVRIGPGAEMASLASLAGRCHYTLAIAPETDGTLAERAEMLARLGVRSLGSDPGAIALAGDKARLAIRLAERGIPTPPTITMGRDLDRLPPWDGPIVIKPVDGAGSVETFVVADPARMPAEARAMPSALVQPFLPGTPMSASFLVDVEGRATCLAVGRQEISVEGSRITYRGGTLPLACEPADLAVVASALDAVPGLRGFVGVDFLLDDRRPTGERATVLEINPRPTTSCVGLARLHPPGTIAAAWLAACSRGLDGTDWTDRLRPSSMGPERPISFAADGTIIDTEEPLP